MTRERLGVLFLFFLWIGLPFLLQGRLSLSLFITAFIQVPMVVGLTLLGGRAGMISLGQAAFYGVGAYGTAILAVHGGWPPVLALGGGIFLTVAVAYLVGLPVLTLRGHDFVLATLALNFIFGVVWRQWLPVTGGSNGLAGIPSLSLGTWAIRGDVSYYYLTGLVALLALFFGYQLLHSGTGRALQTVMASETAAAAVGLRPSRYRLGVFLWAAFWAGLSGGLYAFYVGYVSPSPFSLEFSVQLLLMAVIGGLGSLPGAVVGVFLALFLRESLRTFLPQVVGGISSEYEAVAYGLLLALVVIFWPRGLWPARAAHPAAAGEVATHLPEDPLPAEGVILSVEGLRREFGGLVAVADVSFQVRRGEVVALLGPNGAGKTTLFHMISGLLPPTRGRVVFAGKEVTGLPPYLPAALGLGRTFQIPKLVPTLPPRDNVSVGLPYPWRGSFWQDALRWARRRRAREAVFLARHFLQRVGEKGEEKPLEALPFGRWRTTELARALAGRPRLLLLDEPASGLSPQEKEAFLKAMKDFSRRGGTILWVEHDVPLVMAGADRVLVMNGGRLVAQGTPEEVQKNPAVQEAYLGKELTEAALPSLRQEAAVPAAIHVEVKGLTAGYGGLPVLKDLSLTLERGRLTALVGPNGAGKSTLLKAMAGLLSYQGQVELEGRILPKRVEEVVRKGVVLVPERRQLLPSMTVMDHLLLGAYTRQKSSQGRLPFIWDLFPILYDKRDDLARTLSGGQQQMLAVARALMAEPQVLLLDEPFLGLAPQVVADLLAVLLRLQEEGTSLFLAEQHLKPLLPVSHRVYVLQQGQVVFQGRGAELAERPELFQLYLYGETAGEGGQTGRRGGSLAGALEERKG